MRVWNGDIQLLKSGVKPSRECKPECGMSVITAIEYKNVADLISCSWDRLHSK